MSRRRLLSLTELRLPRDEGLCAELRQFDPYNVMGYIALAAVLGSIVVSLVVPYRTYDELLSVSLVLGLLSFLNRPGPLGAAAVVITATHLMVLHALQLIWPV